MVKKDIKKLFGLKIKKYRLKKGLKQWELADLADVDQKHICCIKSGKNFHSPELIYRLSVALKVEPENFFEFYHLQDEKDLKNDIESMLEDLFQE